MRRLSRMLGDEYRYMAYSWSPVFLLALLLAMACVSGWNADMAVRSAYRDYLQQRQNAIDAGADPDLMLSKPIHRQVSRQGGAIVTETDNPVRESFDSLADEVRSLAPGAFVPTAFGTVTLLVGPLAFSVWGVLLATYDFSSKTVKLKAAKGRWPLVVLARIIAAATAIAVVVAAAVVFIQGEARVVRWLVLRGVPHPDVYLHHAQPISPPSGAVAQYLVAVLVGVVFATLGLCGGIVFRRSMVPLVIVAVYNLFVPSLGRYDLKNATAVVVRSVFSFASESQIITPLALDPVIAAAILAAFLGLAVLISLVAAERQSTFVV